MDFFTPRNKWIIFEMVENRKICYMMHSSSGFHLLLQKLFLLEVGSTYLHGSTQSAVQFSLHTLWCLQCEGRVKHMFFGLPFCYEHFFLIEKAVLVLLHPLFTPV
jgi:hypothetical protein